MSEAFSVLLSFLVGAAGVWVFRLERLVRAGRRSESVHRESQQRLQLLTHALRNANDCITITDTTDHLLYVNEAFLRTYEYTEQEILGQHINVVRSERTDLTVLEAIDAATKRPGWRGEVWHQSRTGRVFPVSLTTSMVHDERGEIIAAVGVARDVEKEKLAEEALRRSETRYRELVENANDIIFTVDPEGYCIAMNRAGQNISGYEAQDKRGVNLRQLVVPEHVEMALSQLLRVLGGEAVPAFELDILNKQGRRLTLELSVRQIHHPVRGAVAQGIARDVTTRKELEVKLQQSQKMDAIGRLAAGVAHDFNNLITVILCNCEESVQRPEVDHAALRSFEDIRAAAERAGALTRQLLTFSRLQILQPSVLNLNDVLSETQRMIARLIGEDLDVQFHPDPDLAFMFGDASQLQQLVLNLAVNARDAMLDGGQLTIETRNIFLDHDYVSTHQQVPSGDYVMLMVSDTGVGMSETTCARIFEPFFTTKEVGRGTGLGLSTAYGIVKQSGGFIWVYSEPAHGTTFKIYFPRVQTPESAAAASITDEKLTEASEIVLVVEDDATVLDVTRRYLARAGYTVLSASNGEEAIALCRDSAPELLITDVVMPGMNGPALAEHLRRGQLNLKVLFLSGYAEAAISGRRLLPSGANFLQKPFAPKALAKKVRAIIDG